MVGASRFERPTPCSQGRCATRLRYAPTPSIIDRKSFRTKAASTPSIDSSLKLTEFATLTAMASLRKMKARRSLRSLIDAQVDVDRGQNIEKKMRLMREPLAKCKSSDL